MKTEGTKMTTESREYDAKYIHACGMAMDITHKQEVIALKELIGKRLKEIRESANISLLAMAALIGSNRGTLYVAESPRNSTRTLAWGKLSELERAYFEAASTVSKVKINLSKYNESDTAQAQGMA